MRPRRYCTGRDDNWRWRCISDQTHRCELTDVDIFQIGYSRRRVVVLIRSTVDEVITMTKVRLIVGVFCECSMRPFSPNEKRHSVYLKGPELLIAIVARGDDSVCDTWTNVLYEYKLRM